MTAATVFWTGLLLIAATVLIFGTGAWVLYRVAPRLWDRGLPAAPENPAPNAQELRALDAALDREHEQRYKALAPRRRGQDLPPLDGFGGAA